MVTQITRAFGNRIGLSGLAGGRPSRRRALQGFRRLMQENVQWNASLFDEHFFLTRLMPMVETCRKNGERVSAQGVASAWADQLNLNARSRVKLMAELASLAEQILAAII